MIQKWVDGEMILFKTDMTKNPWCGHNRWTPQSAENHKIDHTINSTIQFDEISEVVVTTILFESGIEYCDRSDCHISIRSNRKSKKFLLPPKYNVTFPMFGIIVNLVKDAKQSSHRIDHFTVIGTDQTFKYWSIKQIPSCKRPAIKLKYSLSFQGGDIIHSGHHRLSSREDIPPIDSGFETSISKDGQEFLEHLRDARCENYKRLNFLK